MAQHQPLARSPGLPHASSGVPRCHSTGFTRTSGQAIETAAGNTATARDGKNSSSCTRGASSNPSNSIVAQEDLSYIAAVLRFLANWGWASDLQLVHFFAAGHHRRIAADWTAAVEALSEQEAAALVGDGGGGIGGTEGPAALPKEGTEPPTWCRGLPAGMQEHFAAARRLRRPRVAAPRPARALSQRLLGIKGMGPKKVHEVGRAHAVHIPAQS